MFDNKKPFIAHTFRPSNQALGYSDECIVCGIRFLEFHLVLGSKISCLTEEEKIIKDIIE